MFRQVIFKYFEQLFTVKERSFGVGFLKEWRGRISSIFLMILIGMDLIYTVQFFLMEQFTLGATILVWAALALGLVNFASRTGRIQWIGHFLMFCIMGVLTFATWFTGGLNPGGACWFLLVPLMAINFVELRGALVWFAVDFLVVALYFILELTGYAFPNVFSSPQRFDFWMAFGFALIAVSFLTILGHRLIPQQNEKVEHETKRRADAEVNLRAQKRILSKVLQGDTMRSSLEMLIESFEQVLPGSRAFVHYVDGKRNKMKLGAVGLLNPSLIKAIEEISMEVDVKEPFRTLIQKREPLLVEDIYNHPQWELFRELNTVGEFRSIWLFPLISSQSKFIGLLTFCGFSTGRPTAKTNMILQSIIQLATLIVERRMSELAVSESEARFRALTENTSEVTVILSEAGRCKYISPAIREYTGQSQWLYVGSFLMQMIHPDDRKSVWRSFKSLAQGALAPLLLDEVRVQGFGQEWIFFEMKMINMLYVPGVEGIALHCKEVTRQRRAQKENAKMQEQVLHTSKLASMGILAATVAHEINNPLAIIQGYVEILEDHCADEDYAKLPIFAIRDSVKRISDIVQSLRTYARTDGDQESGFDAHETIRKIHSLLGSIYRKKSVRFELDLRAQRSWIQGRSGRLQQVLMNLLSNARDALNDRRDGLIRIESLNGNHEKLILRVSDNGCGIPKEHLEKIFDSNFTTKPPEEGTGLGLGIVLSIIQSMGGQIHVESTPGRGTSCTIEIPLLESSQGVHELPDASIDSKLGALKGHVLLVEDEAPLSRVIRAKLQSFGLTVDVAGDGLEALSMIAPNKYNVVITDLMMPQLDGVELLQKIQDYRIKEGIKMVVITGGNIKMERRDLVDLRELCDFILEKPFSNSELYETMSKCLEVDLDLLAI